MRTFLSTLFYTFAVRNYKIKKYQLALKLNSISHKLYSSARNYSLWGLINFKLNKIEISKKMLLKSLNLIENVDAYQGLILISLQQNDYKRVIEYTNKALNLNPKLDELKVNLVIANVALKFYDDAENVALEILNKVSLESKLLIQKFLAEIYLQKKDSRNLKIYIDKLMQNPTNRIIGQVYSVEYNLLVNNVEAAMKTLKRVEQNINEEKILELKDKINELQNS